MIESKNDTSKNLEKALQALKQAQQRVANEKKKQNEKKRKAENHHKYIMGGIIVKYFPDCYLYDEDELNRILSVALQTKECQQIISKIKAESRETAPPQSTLPNAENESEGGTEGRGQRNWKAEVTYSPRLRGAHRSKSLSHPMHPKSMQTEPLYGTLLKCQRKGRSG